MVGSTHSGSTGTTKKSAQDAFHLEKDLKKAQAASKGKAVERPSSSHGPSGSGQKLPAVGDLLNSRPIIGNDQKLWPKDSELVKDNRGIPMLRNKKTGALTHFVKPEKMRGRKTASVKKFLNDVLSKK